MNDKLRILNLEDSRRDAELNRELLEAAGISCELTRVDTRKEFAAALAKGGIDLILADYRLPNFDGLSALELAKEKQPDVPFIFMTGSLGEEVAIETLKSGATDYVLKQNPARLAQSVHRAIKEARERRERQAVQQALRESEDKFRNLSENLKEMIYRFESADLKPVYVNKAVESIYGYTPQEWCQEGNLRENAIHPDDKAKVRAHFASAGKPESGGTLEYRIIKKDGSIRWVEDNYSIERDQAGRIVSINGVLYDTTERKTAQEALWRERVELGVATRELVASDEELKEYLAKLYQSEEKYRKLMQSANDAIFIADAETGLIIDANQQACKLLDLPLDQIKGLHQSRLHPPEEAEHYQEIFRKHLESGRTLDGDIYVWRRDGTRVPVEISSSIIELDGRQVNQGVFRDITERKRAADALRKSEEFVKSIIDHSPIGIAVRDKDGRLMSYNPAWVRIWGMTGERIARHTQEIKGDTFRQMFDHLGPHLDEVERLFANGGSMFIPEMEIEKPNPGGARWVRQYFYTINDPQGGVDRIIILTDDITDRKQAEEALRKSEEFVQSIIRHSPIGIAVRDKDGRLMSYNPAWVRIWGMTGESIARHTQEIKGDIFRQMFEHLGPHLDEVERLFANGGSMFIPEMEIEKPNPGGARWVRQYFYTINDPQGGVDRIIILTDDITERKRAEEELHESEERLSSFVENTFIGIYRTAPDGRILMSNQALVNMLGYESAGEMVRRNLEQEGYEPGYERTKFKRLVESNGQVIGYEAPWKKKDGTIIWVRENARAVRGPDGTVLFYEGTAEDITQHKWAEKAIAESEARYRLIVENAPAGIYEFDYLTGKIVNVNDVMCEYTGYSREEILAMNPMELLDKDSRAVHLQRLSQAQAGTPMPDVVEYRVRRKDGSLIWCQSQVRYAFEEGKLVKGTYVATNITERKQAEKALHKANEDLERTLHFNGALLSAIPTPVFYKDKEGRYLGCNSAFTEIMGVTSDQIKGKTVEELWPSEHAKVYHEKDMELMRNPARQIYEFKVKDKDGLERPVIYSKDVFRDENNQVAGIVGAFLDITDRKLAEKALRESEEKYRTLIEKAYDGIIIVQDGIVSFANPKMAELDGTSVDKLVGTSYTDHIYPSELPRLKEMYQRRMAGENVPITYETVLKRDDGSPAAAELTAGIITFNGKPADLVVIRDITERKRTEKELQSRNQELEAANQELMASEEELKTADEELRYNLEELEKSRNELLLSEEKFRLLNAGLEQRVQERTVQLESAMKELEAFSYSVSHDLRAPLRHLTGFVNLLQEKAAGLDKKSLHCLEVISDSSLQMGRLIDGILSFSRLNRAEMINTRVSLKVLVRRSLEILEPELKGREIAWKIGELPEVYGDPQLLETVVTNLISNAVKFTSKKKIAAIEIGQDRGGAEEDVIYVRDNGAGFDMRYADKLFKLFQRQHREEDFQGTGVGLANVGRIITRHGGRVWAEGAVDKGATFYFSLPRKRKA